MQLLHGTLLVYSLYRTLMYYYALRQTAVAALQSLASDSTETYTGWQSEMVRTYADDTWINVYLPTANTAPAGHKKAFVYVIPWMTTDNGTNWKPWANFGTASLPTGVEGTATASEPNSMELALRLPYEVAQQVLSGSFKLSSIFGDILPQAFSLFIRNETGAAFTTGCVVEYMHIAFNGAGIIPVEISSILAEANGTTAATISCTLSEECTTKVEYGTTTALGSVLSSSTLTLTPTLNLQSLTAGTKYYYRIRSVNSKHVEAISDIFDFTTQVVGATAPVISNVVTTSINATSQRIACATDVGTTYKVQYGTTNAYGQTSALDTTTDKTAHTVDISGLTPSTLYYYNIVCTKATGEIGVSAGTFTTAAVSSGVAISNVQVVKLSPTSVQISWTLSGPGQGWVVYGPTTSYGFETTHETSLNYSAHTQLVQNLTAGTLYHFKIYAVDGSSVTTTSLDNVFTTEQTSTGLHAPEPTSPTITSVLAFGAKGDGVTNDTAKIQAGINQVGGTGGTLFFPAGTYLVSIGAGGAALNLKSNMTVKLDTNATIKLVPNNSTTYFIFKLAGLTNVNIIGGKLQGERHQHLTAGDDSYTTPYSASCTSPDSCFGQWGMGVGVYGGSNLYFENIHIREMWGDAFYISDAATKVRIYSCNMQDNRRQGVSLIHCTDVVVHGCTINGTYGHKPECGIDFEPNDADKGILNVQILNNTITGNKGSGIQVGVPARLEATCTILGVLIDGNTVTGNGRVNTTTAGLRIESIGADNGVVATNNIVTGNTGRAGIGVDTTSGQRVQYNTVKNNTVTSGQIWERWGTNNILTPNTLV
jgi:hypothetical protein